MIRLEEIGQDREFGINFFNLYKYFDLTAMISRPTKESFILAKYKDGRFCQKMDEVNVDSLNNVILTTLNSSLYSNSSTKLSADHIIISYSQTH